MQHIKKGKMKTKYKKIKNKIFVGLGATATIVAPVVSTVSFAIRAGEGDPFDNFINKWIPKIDGKVVDPTLWIKVLDSTYYNNLDKGYKDSGKRMWRLKEAGDIKHAITALATVDSNIFSDDEKFMIANSIMRNQAYTDFIENIGLNNNANTYYSVITNNARDVKKGLVAEEQTSSHWAVGKTGYQTDYHQGKNDQYNNRIYDISNEDILKYFESIAFISDEFNELFKATYYYIHHPSDDDKNPGPQYSATLVEMIKKWNIAVENFWTKIMPEKTNLNWFMDLPDFKYIKKINSTATDEKQAYFDILDSTIVSRSRSKTSIEELKKSFNDDEDEMRINFDGIVSSINTTIKTFRQKAVDYLKTIASNSSIINSIFDIDKIKEPDKIVSGENFESVLSFAKAIMDYSNHLQDDVELKINDHPFDNPGITIRTGHENSKAWDNVDNLKIKILFTKYNSRGNIAEYFAEAKSPIFSATIFPSTIYQINNKNYKLPFLRANPKPVMQTDYAIYFSMKLKVDSKYFTPRIILYENDHDDDSGLKNITESRNEGLIQDLSTTRDIITGIIVPGLGVVNGIVIWRPAPSIGEKVILTESNKNPTVWLNFWRQEWLDNESPNEWTLFDQLGNALEYVFEEEWNEWKQITRAQGKFDPNSKYTPTLTINYFEFPEIRFNTFNDDGWDDTHSDNFRFDNAKVNYSFKVDETIY